MKFLEEEEVNSIKYHSNREHENLLRVPFVAVIFSRPNPQQPQQKNGIFRKTFVFLSDGNNSTRDSIKLR